MSGRRVIWTIFFHLLIIYIDLAGGRLTFKRQLSVFLSFHYEDTELSFEHVEYFLQKLRKKCIKR